jgi:hypothetical protein
LSTSDVISLLRKVTSSYEKTFIIVDALDEHGSSNPLNTQTDLDLTEKDIANLTVSAARNEDITTLRMMSDKI